MLEKPDIPDESIIDCLLVDYGLKIAQIAFLPLGADRNTAVYRADANDSTPYFVKLRLAGFDETSVELPKFLSAQGIRQVMAPLATGSGRLWADLDGSKVVLYPFVEGRNGYEARLSDHHWHELGEALGKIHAIAAPPSLIGNIRREAYSPLWRDHVKRLFDGAERIDHYDPISAELSVLLACKRDEILDLVRSAERLACSLQDSDREFVVCHSDIHAGNVLIDSGGAFYIVDWDDPILAPRERDLMYIGGGLMGAGRTPQEEETLFYRAYGRIQLDTVALAYYRHERIVQDISEICRQVFSTNDSVPDRERMYQFLPSNFRSGGVLDIARNTEQLL
ncbi:MAG: aminoglycoside phosphotransferase family protein [SAR202 cluster bacterium]|jgi:spectinomycin phosphotransferase|nr:phosphotransferase [Chloroflexota bacterium]MDP6664341.1 phosphotransferase [SAR202 cluster bacterium]MDP6798817.1 phosphotransferase [SAR202 cluster bacterium]MQG58824.1 aminoglycoside phosphotransferase family protein [SAR202 cluster bacterium]MQG69386.1 aminoglycoside phosphotransferase family protein [SAR202 cluster bacterium]|tara:strand:+ start:3252 stop:4262 length:1011 start_codon:yes stop_codon:yes gene_type:complete